ncbi:protein-export chaperone SecB [Desulfonatronovibrio hydrogenovorans]|uniref:protein-export chaperone SecB n=1 Tax=Desulfonatronovibrio hydrogenovorans TaxID=53245 RepID=UPI000490C079|nr:protein-export chaperone SecB [Desulfonatronovibrio hydrogenovorans]
MKSKKSEDFKIPPDKYREILRNIRLKEIVLLNANIKSNRDNFAKSLKVDINLSSSSFQKHDDNVDIDIKCRLVAFEEKKSHYAILMESFYRMSIIAGEGFDEDFFEIYKEINLPVNIWPYFREFIANTSYRMGMPPMTLPFYKT